MTYSVTLMKIRCTRTQEFVQKLQKNQKTCRKMEIIKPSPRHDSRKVKSTTGTNNVKEREKKKEVPRQI